MSTARRIEEFVGSNAPKVIEAPKFVGHLLEMPLTNGEEALIDPGEVISVSSHRTEEDVTVIRQHNDNYTYFVDRPYVLVKDWITQALKS